LFEKEERGREKIDLEILSPEERIFSPPKSFINKP